MGRRASAFGAAARSAHHTTEKRRITAEKRNPINHTGSEHDYEDETSQTEEEEEEEVDEEEDQEDDEGNGEETDTELFVLDSVFLSILHSRLARKIQTTGRRWSPALECGCLLMIFLLSFCVRLFSVIRFESLIHEFDPYFNYRTTKYLVDEGFYEFWNWFDYESWYPLGRGVGHTLFPGLMCTGAALHWLAHACGFPIPIRDICVFLAPFFSGLTALATYLLVKSALQGADKATDTRGAAEATAAAAAEAAAAEATAKEEGVREEEAAATEEKIETAVAIAAEGEKEEVKTALARRVVGGRIAEATAPEKKKEEELATAAGDDGGGRGAAAAERDIKEEPQEGGEEEKRELCEEGGSRKGTDRRASGDAWRERVESPEATAAAAAIAEGTIRSSISSQGGGGSAAAAAGLFAALFVGVCPSYLSRSVAGSFDNEAVAIFALVNGFACWVRAVQRSSMSSALAAAAAAAYMVSAWGGYVFLINAVAVYIAALAILGRLAATHCVSYNVFYIITTALSLNIPFVGHAAIASSEHMAAHAAAAVVNGKLFALAVQSILPQISLKFLLRLLLLPAVAASAALFVWLSVTGRTGWSSRSLTLLDPTYAAKHLPIIASVSEHQPTTWVTYVFDLHAATVLAPLGMVSCLRRLTDGTLFLSIFGLLAAYFSGIMVRLMLVLSPAAAALSGVGASALVHALMSPLRLATAHQKFAVLRFRMMGKKVAECTKVPAVFAVGMLVVFSWLIVLYIKHCTWVASFVYSQPSIVLSGKMRDGSRLLQDDYREAYYWLRQNTHPRARIMAWWDYGYQATAMANRTVLVDNNTWNNTHIATVALAFASDEDRALAIMQELDVDYVFVVFGGISRHQSDDLNKFIWMVRIASGVYPTVQQSDYLNRHGLYTIGPDAPSALTNSLMYKLSYNGINSLTNGYDFLRNVDIGRKEFTLEHFEEAYTTENWLIRIYKVKKPANRPTARQRRITAA